MGLEPYIPAHLEAGARRSGLVGELGPAAGGGSLLLHLPLQRRPLPLHAAQHHLQLRHRRLAAARLGRHLHVEGAGSGFRAQEPAPEPEQMARAQAKGRLYGAISSGSRRQLYRIQHSVTSGRHIRTLSGQVCLG